MLVLGTFEKAKKYIESLEKNLSFEEKKIKSGICLTISRESGAGADVVSKLLVKYFEMRRIDNTLPWTVFDRNLIEKVLEDHHLPKRLSKFLEEKKFSVTTSIMNELFNAAPSTWDLVHKTSETILQLGETGNVIIIGNGASVVTSKLQNSFHVRLVSNLEDRIKHIEKLHNLNYKEALEHIKNEDNSRKDYLWANFRKDIYDPLNYDLIVNTGSLGFERSAKIISNAVVEKFPGFLNKPK